MNFKSMLKKPLEQKLFAGNYVGKLVKFEPADKEEQYVRIVMDVEGKGICSTVTRLTETWFEIFTNSLRNQFPNMNFLDAEDLFEHCKHNKVYFHVVENEDARGYKYYNWRMTRSMDDKASEAKVDEATEAELVEDLKALFG